MRTIINSNGSKWLGQSPDTSEQLYAVLQEHPLDPTFEQYGNFVYAPEYDKPEDQKAMAGLTRFWGNFFDLSHVFSIDTDDPDVIATLTALIRQNQNSRLYQDAKHLQREQKEQERAHFAKRRLSR